jgi:predicted nucleotidyltransferase
LHYVDSELQDIVKKILNTTNVSQIFVFGSYAYGTPSEDSDIDLCVITNDKERKIEIIKKIRRAIKNIATMPIDILVYDKDDFIQRASLSCTLEHKIAFEGVSLYDA